MMRSLAATTAVTMTSLAVPWIMPPPPFELVLRKHSGSPMRLLSQSIITVSSSVMAGEHIQLNAAALKAPEYMSPIIAGKEELHG
jgi:hypothetical protein